MSKSKDKHAADPERLRRIADALGVPVIHRHIFLCCDQTKANGRVTILPPHA